MPWPVENNGCGRVGNSQMGQLVYERLIDAGKPAKVAFTAIMRKLILLANALIKQDRMWTQIKA